MSATVRMPSPHAQCERRIVASANRLGWLDTLRGVAILGVVAVHSAQFFPSLGFFSYRVLIAGKYGVDLFFVISGFVLYHTFRQLQQQSASPLRTFIFRRWARLAPVYYAGILLYGVLLRTLDGHTPAGFRDSFWNLLFINGWIPDHANTTVLGGWSISAEAAFAVLFVGVVPLMQNVRNAFALFAVSWVVCRVTTHSAESFLGHLFRGTADFGEESIYFPWRHMPTFLLGPLCWHIWHMRRSAGRTYSGVARLGLLLASALLLATICFPRFDTPDRVLCAGGASASLLLACSEGRLPNHLSHWLAWIGRISFGVYLFHFCFLEPAATLTVAILPIGSASVLLFLGTMAFTLLITIPLAWVSWKFLERLLQIRAANVNFGSKMEPPI